MNAKLNFGLSESMRIYGATVSPLVSVHVVLQPIGFVRSLKERLSALAAPQILMLSNKGSASADEPSAKLPGPQHDT